MNFTNQDNIVNRVLGRIGDIVLLNLMFIICCIPIFTIGASATALYYSALKMIKGDETSPSKNFLKAFRMNLKQATFIWILYLLVGGILFFNIQFLRNTSHSLSNTLLYMTYGIAALYLLEGLYIFPVIAAFKNTSGNLLKNAFLFTYMHIPSTCIIALLWGFPLFLTFTDLKLFPIYLFCWFSFGFSLITMMSSAILYKQFKKYLPAIEE